MNAISLSRALLCLILLGIPSAVRAAAPPQPVSFIPDQNPVRTPEGDVRTLSIRLDAMPTATLHLLLAPVSGDADLTIDGPTTASISPAAWKDGATFTLRAAEDDDTNNNTATFLLTETSGYDIAQRTIVVRELDNDGQMQVSGALTTDTAWTTTTLDYVITSKLTIPAGLTLLKLLKLRVPKVLFFLKFAPESAKFTLNCSDSAGIALIHLGLLRFHWNCVDSFGIAPILFVLA